MTALQRVDVRNSAASDALSSLRSIPDRHVCDTARRADSGQSVPVVGRLDHLVVGSADLEVGMGWVEDRLGVAPVLGGVHDGFGTRNALLGLGYPYLEVLSLDPEQGEVSIPWNERVRAMASPALLTVAISKTPLKDPVRMSRLRSDGVVLEWAVEFTRTPLFFIDWRRTPRPSGLPHGGHLSSLIITTPAPEQVSGVEGISVHAGEWRIEASVDGIPLA